MIWQVFVDGRMNAYWKDSQKLWLRNYARDQSRQKSVNQYKDDFPHICPVHQHHWRWTLRKSSFIQIVQGFHSSSPTSHWNLLDCLGSRRWQLENGHRAIRGVSRRPGMEITKRKYGKDGTLCRRICSPPLPPQPAPSSRLLPPPGNTNQYIKCFHKGLLKASAQS